MGRCAPQTALLTVPVGPLVVCDKERRKLALVDCERGLGLWSVAQQRPPLALIPQQHVAHVCGEKGAKEREVEQPAAAAVGGGGGEERLARVP